MREWQWTTTHTHTHTHTQMGDRCSNWYRHTYTHAHTYHHRVSHMCIRSHISSSKCFVHIRLSTSRACMRGFGRRPLSNLDFAQDASRVCAVLKGARHLFDSHLASPDILFALRRRCLLCRTDDAVRAATDGLNRDVSIIDLECFLPAQRDMICVHCFGVMFIGVMLRRRQR